MILLRPDCLVFKTLAGENIPCSAHAVTVEVLGDAGEFVEKDTVENAALAVLHYFKKELCKETVTVAEFTDALEKVLQNLGLDVKTDSASILSPAVVAPKTAPARVCEADLSQIASESTDGGELHFFLRLRDTLRRQLDGSPVLLRYRGLRPCVKQLAGAKRWNHQCRHLQDQIVDYLRTCLRHEESGRGCGLVVL